MANVITAALQGPPGPGFSTCAQFNHGGTGGQQPTGSTLSATQGKALLDTTGGACLVIFPAAPIDGQTVTFMDGSIPGNWGTTSGQAQGNTGQRVEQPIAPGTFTAAAGTVAFPFVGGSVTYTWSSALSAWLLQFAVGPGTSAATIVGGVTYPATPLDNFFPLDSSNGLQPAVNLWQTPYVGQLVTARWVNGTLQGAKVNGNGNNVTDYASGASAASTVINTPTGFITWRFVGALGWQQVG